MIDALCAAVLDGTAQPHELPALLHDLWRDGFRLGNQAAQARIARAERAADHWYYVANNPAEARAEHERTLKIFDVMEFRRRKAVGA